MNASQGKATEQYTAEWMLNHLPALPKNFEKQVNDGALKASRYLFCHREKGVRYGYCTHCHGQGRVGDYNELRRAGERGLCPFCDSTVIIKDEGRSRKKLEDEGYIYLLQKMGDGGVVIRAGYVVRDYSSSYEDVKTEYTEVYLIYYNTGIAISYAKYYSHACGSKWLKTKCIPTPRPRTGFFAMHSTPVTLLGFKNSKLKNTALRYCDMERFLSKSKGRCVPEVCQYLAIHAKHPALAERLEKEGFIEVIYHAANGCLGVNVKWSAKTVPGALGLTRDELAAAKDEKTITKALAWRQYCKKHGITKPAERAWVKTAWDNKQFWEEILQYTTVSKLCAYIEKQQALADRARAQVCHAAYALTPNIMRDWRDYLNQCEKLGLDLREKIVLFPRNLHEAHRRNTDIINQRALEEARQRKETEMLSREEAAKKFMKRLPSLQKKYNRQQGDFLIRVAESDDDLLKEGTLLGHCVHGGYTERHFKGRTLILLIRRASEPDRPFFTVEYNEKTLAVEQCRGKGNCAPPDEVKDFLDGWNYEMHKFTRQKNQKEARIAA